MRKYLLIFITFSMVIFVIILIFLFSRGEIKSENKNYTFPSTEINSIICEEAPDIKGNFIKEWKMKNQIFSYWDMNEMLINEYKNCLNKGVKVKEKEKFFELNSNEIKEKQEKLKKVLSSENFSEEEKEKIKLEILEGVVK